MLFLKKWPFPLLQVVEKQLFSRPNLLFPLQTMWQCSCDIWSLSLFSKKSFCKHKLLNISTFDHSFQYSFISIITCSTQEYNMYKHTWSIKPLCLPAKLVSSFSCDHCKSQEEIKTVLMQNFGRQTKSIMVF